MTGSPSLNSFQFTGRENDAAGLYFYRSRYYTPPLHRFLTEDHIALFGGIHLYRYVLNNRSRSPTLWDSMSRSPSTLVLGDLAILELV